MVIFINGASNAGKSTVAHLLAKKIHPALVIEIDTLVRSSQKPHPMLRVREGMRLGIELIQKALTEGHAIIIPFPLSKEHYTFFCQRLKNLSSNRILFFTLSPSLETILAPRGNRRLTTRERERIRHFYHLSLHRPDFGITIDTTRQTPEETTDIIFRHCQTTTKILQ